MWVMVQPSLHSLVRKHTRHHSASSLLDVVIYVQKKQIYSLTAVIYIMLTRDKDHTQRRTQAFTRDSHRLLFTL